jgi:hypothetical protein
LAQKWLRERSKAEKAGLAALGGVAALLLLYVVVEAGRCCLQLLSTSTL